MKTKIVILDFDGTLTNTKKEAKPFLIGFKKDIAKLLNKKNIDKEWKKKEKEIWRNSEIAGGEFRGKIVSRCNVDSYMEAATIAQQLLEEAKIFKDKNKRDKVIEEIYRRNYLKTTISFKRGSKEVLEGLIQKISLFIVTNSRPDAIIKKLEKLNPRGKEKIKIVGDAEKYYADSNFDAVPETITINGLKRPILLRRKKYFDVLSRIWKETSYKPKQTLVVGDNLELDLVLPAVLGCNIFLVINSNTPSYEIEAVTHKFKGYASKDIKDILKVIN